MNKNVFHDMIFFKTTFIIFYPQNVHIYLQHINIFYSKPRGEIP